MHTIVKLGGGLTALIGTAISIFAFSIAAEMGFGAMMFLGIGLSTLLAGAVLYCFGAIVDHLGAIRKSSARQVEIYERMGEKKNDAAI